MLKLRKASSSKNGSVLSTSTNPYYHYVRAYTPSVDYTPTVDYSDAVSRELQLNGSEFSVDSYRRSKGRGEEDERSCATPATMSTMDERVNDRESSPSNDSGIAEMNIQILDKEELGAQCAEMCRELKTVTGLSQDFLKDAVGDVEAAADLLRELENKIRPFLITLDEEMSLQEVTLRKNIDRCKVSDARVSWLLRYNGFTLEFRTILTCLATEIFEELEHYLRLRSRGCVNLSIKRDIRSQLGKMMRSLQTVDEGIRHERSLPETA